MNFLAKDVMTRQLITIHARDSVDDACALLLRHRISGVPVVDDDGALVGIVTEFDLLSLLYSARVEPQRVEDVLTDKVITVDENEPLTDVAEIFLSRGLRRLPVVCDGRLTGIISRRDVVRFIRELRLRLRLEMNIRRDVKAELSEAAALADA